VLLGEPYQAHPSGHTGDLPTNFDSLIAPGDTKKKKKRKRNGHMQAPFQVHREFVLFDSDRIYPEYVIHYSESGQRFVWAPRPAGLWPASVVVVADEIFPEARREELRQLKYRTPSSEYVFFFGDKTFEVVAKNGLLDFKEGDAPLMKANVPESMHGDFDLAVQATVRAYSRLAEGTGEEAKDA
jgi:hypothetical protein